MPPNEREFRRDKRVAFAARTALGIISGRGGIIEDAFTIDLSESGARVRLNGEIVPGQVVELFLDKCTEQCRVVWTRQAGVNKELIAGLEFLYPLPDSRRSKLPPFSEFEPFN